MHIFCCQGPKSVQIHHIRVYLFFLSQVTIEFLDYGGTDVVDKSMLRPLPVEFLQLPFQGIACTLQGMYENMLGQIIVLYVHFSAYPEIGTPCEFSPSIKAFPPLWF